MREVKWEAAWWWIAKTMQIFQRDILEPLCADMRGGVYGGRSGNRTIAALYALYDQAGGFRSVVESLPDISQKMAERMSAEEMGGLLALSQQIDEAYGLDVGIPSGEISISGKLSDRWVREAGGRWKLGKAVELAWPRLLPEVVKEFGDPLAMAAMLAVVMGVAIAVGATGGGLLAEAALLGVGLLVAGKGLSDGIVRLVEFFKLVEKAKTVEELWEAADAFADAMAKLAVNGLFLLLSVLGVKKMNSKINAGDYLAKQVKLNNYKSAKQLYQQEILNQKQTENKIIGKTFISEEIKIKILEGQRINQAKNDIIGGHSPNIINNTNHNYAVQEIKINSDGTRVVKYITQYPDNKLSKIKTSTLFPANWSDSEIINAIEKIGDLPPIGIRNSEGLTLHRGMVNNIEIDVIKNGNNVISGFPVGGKPTTNFDPIP